MKTTLHLCLLALFAFPAIAHAQSLPGGWGLSFGMSSEDVIRKVKEDKRLAVTQARSYQNEKTIVYRNANFADYRADSICLGFIDNKLYNIVVMFPFDKDPYVSILTYTSIQKDIITRYTDPQENREYFLAPYDKDSDKGKALGDNKLSLDCVWKFKSPVVEGEKPGPADANGRSIGLKISNNLQFYGYKESMHNVILTYTDDAFLVKSLNASAAAAAAQAKADAAKQEVKVEVKAKPDF